MHKWLKYGFLITLMLVVVIVLMHVVSALTLDRIIQYKEITFSSPKIPKELDGYVIAFVTDTHEAEPEKLAAIAERINARKVNLLLLGGDYIWGKSDATMQIFSAVKAADGVYGVDGNHDSIKDLRQTMPKYGFMLLEDEGLVVKPGFYLGGVTFYGGNKDMPSIKNAIAGAKPDDFVLLLTHNPDIALDQITENVDLVLAGHTHGGQVTFLGLWAPALTAKGISRYGHKFKSGWANAKFGTKVFVSNGLGRSSMSIRVFARPQIIFLTLKAQ